LDYALDNPGSTLQQAMAVRRSYAPPFVSSLPSMGEETKSFDFKESFFLFSLFLGLLCLWMVAVNFDTHRSSSASFPTWIEPQALIVSLVSLALTRAVCEVCSSLFSPFSRLRASPLAQPPSTQPIRCSPSLSIRQQESLHQTQHPETGAVEATIALDTQSDVTAPLACASICRMCILSSLTPFQDVEGQRVSLRRVASKFSVRLSSKWFLFLRLLLRPTSCH
jgi:hypothetical protein